jgi:hypothetical protein
MVVAAVGARRAVGFFAVSRFRAATVGSLARRALATNQPVRRTRIHSPRVLTLVSPLPSATSASTRPDREGVLRKYAPPSAFTDIE